MCRQDSRVRLSSEEEIAAEESLSIYCKPVEFYNILQRRAIRNVMHLVFYFFIFGAGRVSDYFGCFSVWEWKFLR